MSQLKLVHGVHRHKGQGFTLLELVAVIFMIGVLSAIFAPFFQRQINRSRQSEAQQVVSAILRAQSGHYATRDQFARNIESLEIGSPAITANYSYFILVNDSRADVEAHPNRSGLVPYAGTVAEVGDASGTRLITKICEGNNPLVDETARSAITPNQQILCPLDYFPLGS